MRAIGLLRPVALLALTLGSAAIAVASAVYFDDGELAPFVIEKFPLAFPALFLSALKIHVISAVFSLPACLALVTKTLMRRAPRLHRWLGRITASVVLLALVPSGFALAFTARGGALATVGFILSGIIVAVAMVQAVRTARRREYAAHRRWTLHVLAQLSVAVTSRVMLLAFDAAAVDADLAYLISLWLPVLASAGVAEWLTSPLHRRKHESLAHPLPPWQRDVRLRHTAGV